MSENSSLKMGVKFAVSLNMGKSLYLHKINTYKNGENALQSIQLYQMTKR